MTNLAKSPAAEEFRDLATNRGKFPIVDREQDTLPIRRKLADFLELLLREHQRLLAQNVPSALERRNGYLEMRVRRRANIDEIEILRQIRNGSGMGRFR